MLVAALRTIVRNIHSNGKSITFPVIDEVDRIHLRANGITSDPQELWKLVIRVFQRRDECFQLNNVYRQFVMAYGRVIFEPTLKFPACFIHLRNP